jgi:DNA-directed RNA polymerase subunit RPC12/RpoP
VSQVKQCIEVVFPCSQCGEEVMAIIHTHENYDGEVVCEECGRRYRVYKPRIEEMKE